MHMTCAVPWGVISSGQSALQCIGRAESPRHIHYTAIPCEQHAHIGTSGIASLTLSEHQRASQQSSHRHRVSRGVSRQTQQTYAPGSRDSTVTARTQMANK